MQTVQEMATEKNMHPVDVAMMYIIKIDMSKSGLTQDEIVEIANRARSLTVQTHQNVGEIMKAVTGKPVMIYGKNGRTYVKLAKDSIIARLEKRGIKVSLV